MTTPQHTLPVDGNQELRVLVERERQPAIAGRDAMESRHICHIDGWELDLDTETFTWSGEHYRILGLEPDVIHPSYEQSLKFVHPEDVQHVRDTIAATVTRVGACDIEFRIIRADGRERTVHSRAEAIPGADGRAMLLVGTMQDITEHKQVEAALQRSEQQLRTALAERRQLSQDLQNNILQAICAVSASLEHSQRMIEEGHVRCAARDFSWEIDALKNLMRDIRRFIREQESLLLSAEQLQTELTRMTESRELGCFAIDVDPATASQLMPEEARQMLNIAREAMNNSARHAYATSGGISLRTLEESVRFELRDDGVGFDIRCIEHRGEGLKNIATYARQIGAQIEVLSRPGHGTHIVLDLPLLARSRSDERNRQ